MARVRTKTLNLQASPSGDANGYILYMQEDGPIDIETSQRVELGTELSHDLHGVVGNVDGLFTIGAATLDDAGGESDLLILATDYPLDFVPPLPPAGGEIVDGGFVDA